jgi:Pentapeptide repeats (8 copies)/GYF domain 2
MLWYIRKQNKVTGPFPLKQLQQSILLGRLSLHDEVSKDKQEWLPVRTVPGLIPEVLKADSSDPQIRERIEAARRWADERRGERRDGDDKGRAGPGRREPETHGTLGHRHQRETTLAGIRRQREKLFGGAVLVLVILGVAAYVGFSNVPKPVPGAQCDSKPRAEVNWSSCNLVGLQAIKVDLSRAQLNGSNLLNANLFGANLTNANLAYANFTQANLSFADMANAQAKGANFIGADLSSANLSNADLSYTNLRQAKLDNANLSGARLDNAIWIDGKPCAVGSIGKCVMK